MTGYDIFLSDGNLLTTINVKTVDDRAHSPLVLIGQGIPDYGAEIAQDFVWLLENFSKSTAPTLPLIGQLWHDRFNDRVNFYSSTEAWRPVLSANTGLALFDMLGTSQNIDVTALGSTAIFTGDASKVYLPLFLMLVPTGPFTGTTPATINLSVSTTGDVLSNSQITVGADDQYVRLALNSQPRMVISGATATLNVVTAATGGQLNYDAYLFGFTI